MRKRWAWALVLALILQSLAFAACAEEEKFSLPGGMTWETTEKELRSISTLQTYQLSSDYELNFDGSFDESGRFLAMQMYDSFGGNVRTFEELRAFSEAFDEKYVPADIDVSVEDRQNALLEAVQLLENLSPDTRIWTSDYQLEGIRHWTGLEDTDVFVVRYYTNESGITQYYLAVFFFNMRAMKGKADAPATDETFVLRDGFTWQTTQEELLALMDGYEYSAHSSYESDFSDAPEGSREEKYEYSEYDGYAYEFFGVPVAGYQGLMSVMYSGKVPLVIGYRIANGDVEKLTAALDAKYTPAEADETELIALAQKADRIVLGEELDYSDVFGIYLKHWVGPENTQIYLYQYQIEDYTNTMVMYFNASALENEDISTPVNTDGL